MPPVPAADDAEAADTRGPPRRRDGEERDEHHADDGDLEEVVVDAAEDALLAELIELEEEAEELAEAERGERESADGSETEKAGTEAVGPALADVEVVRSAASRASSLIATPGSASIAGSLAGSPDVDIIEVREANSLADRDGPESVVSTSPSTVDVDKDGDPQAAQAAQGAQGPQGAQGAQAAGNGRRLVTQKSSVWTRRQQAVCVRHAFKHYGSNKNPNHVLQNLNMTVPKGTIYGLLGASGCGKTTLLSCLVGRRHLNSGEIWVLGGKPGTKGSGVPGKRVGYMPQEIALLGEFSIRETMMYFGWIFGMPTSEIQERLDFLLNFLDLPSQNRLVKNLSGGQQRRVSFAVALMHDPELLILDEPTVGVDPLLRQSIWHHLVQITKDGNKTVIITTHYIEEARQAHAIGLMRSGKLLAEESPSALLTTYNCVSLEEVFLKLSRKQGSNAPGATDANMTNNISVAALNWGNKKDEPVFVTEESGVVGLNFHQSKEMLINESNGHLDQLNKNRPGKSEPVVDCDDCTDCFKLTTKGKMRALLQKNFLRMWRNVGVMLFIFALPVMQVILFCLAIGRNPTGLHVAIVNHEMNFTTKECPVYNNCSLTWLSCRYIQQLDNETIVKDYYETKEEALDAVRSGDAWGALYFTENFTDALVARMALGQGSDNETLDQSEIRVWLDMSNQQIGLMLNRDLQFSYRDFAQDLLSQCNNNPKLADIPIQFKEPIYGSNNPSFTDFVAPGVILTIVFFLAVALTSSALIIERMEGLLDRSWVAGVSPFEILFSHVVTQFVVMCGQTALVLIFMIVVFQVECKGDMFWVIILTILQGLCGMCFGFVISAICELERNAIQLALGSFYPTLLLSGVIWPVEGMPVVLRYISLGLPLTMATTSLRSMLTRGWSITEPDVYNGFFATIIWIALFLTISLVVLKVKRG